MVCQASHKWTQIAATCFTATLLAVLGPTARAYDFASTGLVDHPVSLPDAIRTPNAWRQGVGQWGETVGQEMLRLRGFGEVHEIKNGSNNGLDRIAVKRGPNGRIADFRIVEIKTSRSDLPKLNTTKAGIQMGRDYLAHKFRTMRSSGNPEVRRLALDLSRFRRASGRPLSSFGEVMHVNPAKDRIVGYQADGRTVKYTHSLERTLRQLQQRGTAISTRAWAGRQLAAYKQMQSSRMGTWVRSSASAPSFASQGFYVEPRWLPWPLPRSSPWEGRVINFHMNGVPRLPQPHWRPGPLWGRVPSVAVRAGSRQASKALLLTTAKRTGQVLTLGFTGYEIYATERAYAMDRITLRERRANYVRIGGGFAGGLAGASAGAAGGAALGALTGPGAPVFVPLFAAVGGIGGSIAGGIGGSAAADYGMNAWYQTEDETLQRLFEERFVSMRFPLD